MKKTIITMLLAMSLALPLAGCGGSSSTASTSESTSVSKTGDKDKSEAKKAGSEKKKTDSNKKSASKKKSTSTASKKTDEKKSGLTAENFMKIDMGMTLDQVAKLLGSKGKKASETSIAGTKSAVYAWSGSDLSTISVTFTDGKASVKSQAGVITSKVKVSLKQYEQVKTGMTYDQVKKVLGGDGALMSADEILGVKGETYSWSGKSLLSSCTIIFSGGKVSSVTEAGLE
ncbi:MAG: DUF3862 domain-containing protein [bacterium LCO1.1]|uniref:DUF3862 domain-containing protein n=1 Tax=Candidatus Weimeria bifida TaxID=2599074 RepID=A0A6N7IZ35_9FIRM|nr:DUF3862 domain-containing protein [Candidatus Weimeria bifida]